MSCPITPERLAVQFFTLRELTRTRDGFRSALGQVAELGYRGVQLSAVGAMNDGLVSATEAKAWLDELGLVCTATHRPLKNFLTDIEAEIAFHEELGCSVTAIGYFLDQYPNSPQGFRSMLADLTPAAQRLAEAGILLGIHNHDREFVRTGGLCHFDVFIREAPRDFFFEIDTFWVVKAGLDCADLLTRCAGRVPVIHVKDLEMTEEGARMAPVGEGNLPWDRILAAGEASGVQTYIVEQDDTYRDPFDCLASSFNFLTGWEPR